MRNSKMHMAVAMAALGLGLAEAPAANAAFIVTIEQVGSNVVDTGSGAINLTDLVFQSGEHDDAVMVPASAALVIGPVDPSNLPVGEIYGGLSGPSAYGVAGFFDLASSGSGDHVGLFSPTEIIVPQGYLSDAPLSDSATYDNATFASLGLTPGTYTWTWGSGANADSFTLDIGVPEPASFALMGAGLVALAFGRRHRGIRHPMQ